MSKRQMELGATEALVGKQGAQNTVRRRQSLEGVRGSSPP